MGLILVQYFPFLTITGSKYGEKTHNFIFWEMSYINSNVLTLSLHLHIINYLILFSQRFHKLTDKGSLLFC